MPNPLFKMNNNQINQNPLSMLSKFNEFKRMIAGKDVNAMYNEAINSGKYTKAQIEQAKQMAEQFKGILK